MRKDKNSIKEEKLTTPLLTKAAAKALMEKFTNLPLKIRKRKKPLKIKPVPAPEKPEPEEQ